MKRICALIYQTIAMLIQNLRSLVGGVRDRKSAMTTADIVELIEQRLDKRINGADLVGGEGLRLEPMVGVTVEQLEQEIQPTLTEANWIATSLKNGLLIEPRYTSRLVLPSGIDLYHVAWRADRESILTSGLKLGTGGNTKIARKYPPRIFLALGLESAEQFVDFQSRRKTFDDRTGVCETHKRSRDEFDIWKICPHENLKLYTDILFPDKAAWTESSFEPHEIELKANSE